MRFTMVCATSFMSLALVHCASSNFHGRVPAAEEKHGGQVQNGSVGDKITVRVGDIIPVTQEGALWEVVDVIDNSTFTSPGTNNGDILQLMMVPKTRESAGPLFNKTERGGFIVGSRADQTIVMKLQSDVNGKLYVQINNQYFAMVPQTFTVGQTQLTASEKDLPQLPAGYAWKQVGASIDGVGSLIPGVDGSLSPGQNKATYMVTKTKANLPNVVKISVYKTCIASSQQEANKCFQHQ